MKKQEHHSPNRQSIPQPRKPDILVNPPNRRARPFARLAHRVKFRHHHVRRVRDDGAEDSRQVSGGECHSRLRGGRVVGLLAGEALVHHLDDGLEGGELHHRVGDLAAPEGVDAFVEAVGEGGLLEEDHGNFVADFGRLTQRHLRL
jgi:hypothetical protein